jgi:hypothetical protein
MTEEPAPESLQPTFKTLVSELAQAAATCLGEAPHPATGERAVDLLKAVHLLQLLVVVHDKTKGNLDAEEEKFLFAAMNSLHQRFLQVRDGGA